MIHYRTNRLIHKILTQGARSPEEICRLLQGQLNRHTIYNCLNSLVKGGLVTKHKCGTLNAPNRVTYQLAEAEKGPKWFISSLWSGRLNKLSRKEIRKYKKIIQENMECFDYNCDVFDSEEFLELKRLYPQIHKFPIETAVWVANCVINKRFCLGCLAADGKTFRYTIYKKETNRYYCPTCGLESDIIPIRPELREKTTEQVKELYQSNIRKQSNYLSNQARG